MVPFRDMIAKKGEPPRQKAPPFEPVGFTGHSLAQPWRDDLPGPTHLKGRRRFFENRGGETTKLKNLPPKKGVECVFVCFCAPFFWGGVVFGGYSRVDVTYQLLIALMFSSAVFARYFSRISLH